MADVFDKVWSRASSKISPQKLEAKFFTQKNYRNLRKKAEKADGLEELSGIINPFLRSLNISHTQFLTHFDQDYYFFQSLFTARKIEEPRLHHIGAQYFSELEGLYRVRSVLEKYPADLAGLKRGDLILSADGEKFQPISSFKSGRERTLKIGRNGKTLLVKVSPVFESIHESFFKAMKNSIRLISTGKKTLGYIHLWAGTHESFRKELARAVAEDFKTAEGLILDLRDGYGGAWYEYLDPFFKDRNEYFKFTVVQRDGQKTQYGADPIESHDYFDKPMAVLINEGVRSGKESLTFQFKKTRRATLVGTSTPGYFSTGEINFKDENQGYLLYLAISQILLDGQVIEGRGIAPDIHVEYPINHVFQEDLQLKRAVDVLSR
ncbi:MAG: hypothetical protein IT289_05535 [Oligoflexia bacterium]|nr:hypothetical protein [Oligoflexia bacterium]